MKLCNSVLECEPIDVPGLAEGLFTIVSVLSKTAMEQMLFVSVMYA